jgi:signal transduction histidine kinase
MNLGVDSAARWLWVIAGVTGLLGLVLGGEVVVLLLGVRRAPMGFYPGAISALVALCGLGYGVRWIAAGTVPVRSYPRLAKRCLGGAAAFLALNIAFILSLPPRPLFTQISWVQWTLSTGAAVGLLVGIFETRAVERARTAERVRVEQRELERRNELLENFVRIISHDLTDPLRVAEGKLALAREQVDSEHLDDVDTALRRMDIMLDKTRQWAREGQAVGETEPVALESLVSTCWTTVDTQGAKLRLETLPTVEADPDSLRHVFENLFRNAVEHGHEDVTVRVGTLSGENGFFVEDDGQGIPADRRDEIFEIGHTSKDHGSGLGLNIVASIVRAHEWEIRATDGDGGGARFEISGVDVDSR